MNPFELQVELTRQWFGLASKIVASSLDVCAGMNRQLSAAWSNALPPRAAPFAGGTPWAMASFPISFFQPIPWYQQPSWLPAAPFASFFAFPSAQGAWFSPPPSYTAGWPWAAWWSPLNPWAAMFAPRSPGAELMDQVASAYRSASGYATATVLGPFGTALDPRTYGQPWWQVHQKTFGLH